MKRAAPPRSLHASARARQRMTCPVPIAALPSARNISSGFTLRSMNELSRLAKHRLNGRALEPSQRVAFPNRRGEDLHRRAIGPEHPIDVLVRVAETEIMTAAEENAALQTLLLKEAFENQRFLPRCVLEEADRPRRQADALRMPFDTEGAREHVIAVFESATLFPDVSERAGPGDLFHRRLGRG